MPKAHKFFEEEETLNALSENYALTLEQISRSKAHFVVDRGFLTGIVYSKVFKRRVESSYNLEIMKRCKDRLLFVIVTGEVDKIIKRTRSKDRVIDTDLLHKINEEYNLIKNLLKKNNIRYVSIDTTSLSKRECFEKFERFWTSIEESEGRSLKTNS